MRTLGLVVLLVACDAGTKTPPPKVDVVKPPPPAPHTVMLNFGRTVCYGTCPAYSITVYRDGALEYLGEDFVKTKGAAKGTLSPQQVDAIDQLFASKKPPNKDFVSEDATDAPSASFSYTPVTGDKITVHHYFGDMKAPEVLGQVEDGIDSIVHIETWIGTRTERDSLPR
ncbi:MAG: DUF6438 domain-containing protein [Kofleriaceae bacterium]